MPTILSEFEETALLGCKVVREFLLSDGKDRPLMNKSKSAATSMSAYARLRATMAAEAHLKLIARRSEGSK